MTSRDDDLRIRPGRIRDGGRGSRPRSLVGQVLKAAQKAGHVGAGRNRVRARRSTFGRGRGVAAEGRLLSNHRRVVVKARIVRPKGHMFRSAPLAAHVAYLKREGVAHDGEKAYMFDAKTDRAAEAGFAARCDEDRHHFRFIVSPEDAAELTDLRAFARDLMGQMERDLDTKLEWIGVDHWNTDNPHVHILVRGRTEDGQDLVISRDYISRGMRARAEELVGVELGPKPERQVRSELVREVEAERWTGLDNAIRSHADDAGVVDLRPARGHSDPEIRRLMVGRLQRLDRMGLATPAGAAQWVIAIEAERTLRDLGVRADIIKTMHRAFADPGEGRGVVDFAIHGDRETPPAPGRLVVKGLHDELTGEAYAVIDNVDGRAHYVRFPGIEALEHAPPLGGIVELRRLEGEGTRHAPTLILSMRSDLPLGDQIRAVGATWIDHQLVGRQPAVLAHGGFGREVREALETRTEYLITEGLARRQGQRVIFARDLLETLRRRELSAAEGRIASETGLAHRPVVEGESVSGIYRQRVTLASARFAMIDDGLGFQLVPWKPSLERQLGRQVTGVVMTGGGIDWSFGHKRGLGIG